MEKNGTTLYEFFEFCLKAVNIYETRAEENGMDGDLETYEILNREAKILKETIAKLRNEWKVINLVAFHTVKEWIDNELDEEQRKTILDALDTIKKDREYRINKKQEDINYIDKIVSQYR